MYSFIAGTGQKLTQAPSNTATKVGQTLRLPCCCGKALLWEMYIGTPVETLSRGPTLGGRCGDERCSINTDNENYELVIKSIVLGDGGKLCCRDGFDNEQVGMFELIVFGKVHFKTLKLMYHRNYTYTFPRFQ